MVKPVGIVSGQEPWCEIVLEDGNRLRVRVVVRGVTATGRTNPVDGMPEYNIAAEMHMQALGPKTDAPVT